MGSFCYSEWITLSYTHTHTQVEWLNEFQVGFSFNLLCVFAIKYSSFKGLFVFSLHLFGIIAINVLLGVFHNSEIAPGFTIKLEGFII